ncbi:MAG TPA: RNA polymerase sigma factor [Candidatus Acidoferrales bacterium]|nr:RNA polymerase sigma factor [Candidatus Acidoferrales bacterium]
MTDDQALWRRICAGNASAFDELFQEVSPRLRGFVRLFAGGQCDAEDIVQETFLQLWKRPDGYDPERGTLRQYMYGIARKRIAQRWRDSGRNVSTETAMPHGCAHDHHEDPSSELSATVRDGLMRLDADARALLWLREAEGYSYSELAEILGVPLGTVKSRLFTAREGLRRIWLNGTRG